MKFINKYFVSRKYYEGSCAYYHKAITRLTEENKLYETTLRKITECMSLLKEVLNDYEDICYETKLNKITECMSLLKTVLNDYDDICEAISKMSDVDCNLRTFAYKLGRILDDHEMF